MIFVAFNVFPPIFIIKQKALYKHDVMFVEGERAAVPPQVRKILFYLNQMRDQIIDDPISYPNNGGIPGFHTFFRKPLVSPFGIYVHTRLSLVSSSL